MGHKRAVYGNDIRKVDTESTEKVSESAKETPFTVSKRGVYVPVLLLKDAIYKVKVGGREYIFNGAGAEVKVLEEDVWYFENKIRKAGCCGGTASRIFEIRR